MSVKELEKISEGFKMREEDKMNMATCLECKKRFYQDRDIQLCDDCVNLFDLDKLWELHDKNKLDALDFNENQSLRERFRKNKWG